jgi:hypothetical protein
VISTDYELLGLGPATSLVTSVAVDKWGSEVLISCLYDPLGSRRPYQLLFEDCHDVRWEVIRPEDVKDLEANLIGFSIDLQGHRHAAVIHTDIFELTILYGNFAVRKDW